MAKRICLRCFSHFGVVRDYYKCEYSIGEYRKKRTLLYERSADSKYINILHYMDI